MQTLGIVDLVWRGEKLPIEKGGKYERGGLKNMPVIYGRQVGRSQEFVAGKVTATMPLERGRSLSALFASGEGELQVLCDTGQSYVHNDAFITNTPNHTGGDGGKVELEFAFGEGEELIDG